VAAAFTVLHGAEALAEAQDWPHAIIKILSVVLVLGTPIVAALAWYHGVKGAKRVGLGELAIIGLLAAIGAGLLWHFRGDTERPAAAGTKTSVKSVAFTPPLHSIAVLPFVNMSGDKEQEYFSEGLTEEILNSLARLDELQVAARTSSFSFQGEHPDIATVAHRLNVGAVLEGSVRRSGNTVRIATQLVNGVTGFHLWSETYDRDLKDVLKLQTEIATAVAGALKVTLLGDVAAKVEVGGTRNPAAFDAYLHGRKAYFAALNTKDLQAAVDNFTEALRLDPNYALAYAARSYAFGDFATEASGQLRREKFNMAHADALNAIQLAPDLAEGHAALAFFHESAALDFEQANVQYERALALAPGNSKVLGDYGYFAGLMGRTEPGVAAARRAVVLDPLNPSGHRTLGYVLLYAHRYKEALQTFADALALDPNDYVSYAWRGFAQYGLGEFDNARSSCENTADSWESQLCLAIVYDKLGQHSDAKNMLAKMKASRGDDWGYEYAMIYAQWGNSGKALEWLETALRVRDPGLEFLKIDPFMDPIRKEPRFQAVMRALKFPD
jgi:TolB-like protein/Flp pilus assembly protein TadD